MTISIATTFHPFRLVLSRKKPIELTIELVNRKDKDTMMTLQIMLSKQLSLDKSGLISNDVKRIDKLEPDNKKRFVFDIYPKPYVEAGEYPVRIKVLEHYQQFKFVEREYTKNLTVSVDD